MKSRVDFPSRSKRDPGILGSKRVVLQSTTDGKGGGRVSWESSRWTKRIGKGAVLEKKAILKNPTRCQRKGPKGEEEGVSRSEGQGKTQ